MSTAILARPDLTRFTGLEGLGVEVTGQHLEAERAVLACHVVELGWWCHPCGTVVRNLAS